MVGGDRERRARALPSQRSRVAAIGAECALESLGRSEARLQLRAEAFNLFNRANFHLPDAFFDSPTFGQVVSADSPRRRQFGVRLIF